MDGDPPIFPDNTVVTDPREAMRLIDEQQNAGYDFAKVYVRLSPEVYDAIVSQCRERDFPFAGHVPNAVGMEAVLNSGQQSIEHLDGFIDVVRRDEPTDEEAFEKRFYFARLNELRRS